MADDLVMVAKYGYSAEASLVRDALEQAGFEAYIQNAASSMVLGVPALALIEIHVPRSQAAEARELIEALDREQVEGEDGETEEEQ